MRPNPLLRPCRLITIFVTIFITFLCSLYQLSAQSVNNVTIPSPNAAEIGRFGAVPVGLFTGSMQNQVLIYEMGNANLKIPVSLQYSSNGFNVDKTASTVGYDWSLDAGGVINHYINGPYDSYVSNTRDYNTVSNKTDDEKYLFLKYYNPVDIFTFTLPGISGSFYLDNNGRPVVIKKGDNLNISIGTNQFTITTADGVKYLFADFVSQPNQGFECWYLSSITHPSGDHIDFTYSPAKSFLLDVLDREVHYPFYDYLNKMPAQYNKEQIIFRNAADRYLERIDVSGVGSMVFTNSYNRPDSKNDPEVDEITVLDAQGNTLRKVKLNYTFAQSNALYDNKDLKGVFDYPAGYLYHKYRMFLNKVEFNDKGGNNVYSYSFQYNDINNLPCRNSYAKDLWGYFNGKPNTDLFATYDYDWLITYFSTNVYSLFDNLLRLGKSPNSCDRSADYTFSQKGMLSRITYPTGGYSNIYYEGHRNEANKEVGGCRVARVETFASNNSNPEIKVYKYPQVVTNYDLTNYSANPSFVLYPFRYTTNCGTGDQPEAKTAYDLRLSPGQLANFSTSAYHLSYSKVEILYGANGENGSEEHEFWAAPQQDPVPIKRAQVYTPFKRFNTDLFNGTLTRIAYKKNNQVQKETIYNYDFSNTKYQESLVCNSVYFNDNALKYVDIDNTSGTFVCYDYANGNLVQFYDVSLYVLYSNFPYLKSKKETIVDDKANTITSETFYDYCDAPYTNVRSVTTKNSKGKDIVTTYKYPFDNQSQNPYGGMVVNYITSPVIETQEYVIDNGQSLLKSTVSADYSDINNRSFCLPTAIYKMENKSLLTSGDYTTYANGLITRGSNFGLLKRLEYDTKGNIKKVVTSNGIITSYLWGYYNAYPVAELINADWATANTYIDQSILNNPPDDATLRNNLNNLRNIPGALVTTYTYKPLVGMTSSTDANGRTTYYEYDDFGRLTYTRDKDNNILKKICYNYAGQPETCPNGVGNAVKSGTFTKSNCSAGYGSDVTYTVPANTYFGSTQADADALAQNDINANGQAYANANGTCVPIYNNVATSGTFKKNNCATGQTGSSVTYTVAANTYTSTISQTDADGKAQNDVNTNGQTYANNNGTCAWYNVAKGGNFTKNDCPAGGTGVLVTYAVPPGTYSSTISQADADQKAQNDVNTNGQAFANSHGVCVYHSVAKSGTFIKNNCTGGQIGSSVTYTVPANMYASIISQADADALAQNDINTNGQTYANNNGTSAWYNVAKSGTFAKNDCPSGYTGSGVTYTIAAGTYSSTISQADADQKAQNDVNTNGQTYANNNGTCGGPCTITINSGYNDLSHGINGNGTTVSFGFALFSYSTMSPATPYIIGTINGGCKPSGSRTLTFSTSGRTWSLVVDTTGQMTLTMTSGSALPPNTVIGTNTLTYNL